MSSNNPEPLTVHFEPQEDITIYELAKLLPYATCQKQPMFQQHWDALGEMQRHFVRIVPVSEREKGESR